MAKLDKSKDYGTIGGTYGIARFEQDGKYFCIEGNELDGEGNPLKSSKGGDGSRGEEVATKTKGNKAKKTDAPVSTGAGDDELAKQLGAQ